MRYPGKAKIVQMISKLVTYTTIVFGGTISGALVGILAGPVRILMSTGEVGILGACLGACLAIVGCKFAMEHHEAREQNRELFRALETRLARVVRAPEPKPLHD
jgi:ammonia channel protein AmtB